MTVTLGSLVNFSGAWFLSPRERNKRCDNLFSRALFEQLLDNEAGATGQKGPHSTYDMIEQTES